MARATPYQPSSLVARSCMSSAPCLSPSRTLLARSASTPLTWSTCSEFSLPELFELNYPSSNLLPASITRCTRPELRWPELRHQSRIEQNNMNRSPLVRSGRSRLPGQGSPSTDVWTELLQSDLTDPSCSDVILGARDYLTWAYFLLIELTGMADVTIFIQSGR